jgi:acyl dehydratase
MPLDPGYVGRSFPPTVPYTVGREKIREFAQAIGAEDAVHLDAAAAASLGHPDVIAPPTFPIVVTAPTMQQMIDDPGLGLDFSRVVHGDQRFTYVRPVHAGDILTCVCTVAEITERVGHGFLTTRTEITDATGELVVTATAKLVVRGE